jgi:hypothetical protein
MRREDRVPSEANVWGVIYASSRGVHVSRRSPDVQRLTRVNCVVNVQIHHTDAHACESREHKASHSRWNKDDNSALCVHPNKLSRGEMRAYSKRLRHARISTLQEGLHPDPV